MIQKDKVLINNKTYKDKRMKRNKYSTVYSINEMPCDIINIYDLTAKYNNNTKSPNYMTHNKYPEANITKEGYRFDNNKYYLILTSDGLFTVKNGYMQMMRSFAMEFEKPIIKEMKKKFNKNIDSLFN